MEYNPQQYNTNKYIFIFFHEPNIMQTGVIQSSVKISDLKKYIKF